MSWKQVAGRGTWLGAAVAALVLALADGGEGGAVKSVTRGDTSVTYATASGGLLGLEALAPWRRLGTLKDEPEEGL